MKDRSKGIPVAALVFPMAPESKLCLFFSPNFPGRVFRRDNPQHDLRGGYWIVDPWHHNGDTVPRRVWLAGRRQFCDLRFDCDALSRIHFTILFEPGKRGQGHFGVLSGGHHPNKRGELEYHPSSLGVWVLDRGHWKKASPGEPADPIDSESSNRLWLGIPNAQIIVGNSPDDTIGDYLWQADLWPDPVDNDKPLITSKTHEAIESQVRENASQWDLLMDWGEWLQAAPRNWQEAVWKFVLAMLIGAIVAVAVYAVLS